MYYGKRVLAPRRNIARRNLSVTSNFRCRTPVRILRALLKNVHGTSNQMYRRNEIRFFRFQNTAATSRRPSQNSYSILVDGFIIPFQLSIGVSVLCVPWLRWTQPELTRPIKVNLFFPVAYIAATVFVTVIPIVASPVATGISARGVERDCPIRLAAKLRILVVARGCRRKRRFLFI